MNTLQKVLFSLAYFAALVILAFGTIFLMAAGYDPKRFIIGGILIASGIVLIIVLRLRQKVTIEQKITLKPKDVKQMKCKECGANLSNENFIIKKDIVIVKCPYCGALYELSDEPIW
ncbi:MAG: hypothetical protein ACTSVI_11280 [Promethearchaeota archaeon]